MIDETSDAILAELNTITGVKTVDEWVGDIDELIKKPAKTLPGLFLIYGSCQFGDKVVIGANIAPLAEGWTVVVIGKSLRSRKAGAASCYALIEAVRKKLIGFKTGYGVLWPVEETLIAAVKGTVVYGCNYKKETETEGVE